LDYEPKIWFFVIDIEQNPMVEANIQIIKELKLFLKNLSSDIEFRKALFQSETDFIRDRKLPLERVIGILINMPKRSLSIEIQDFFNSLEKQSECVTKAAFSIQRTKLKPVFFHVWNQCLVTWFYHYYQDKVKLWRGFVVQAVDGSSAYLLNKEEINDHFGTHANQHTSVPMARIMQIQDVLNDITIRGGIFPIIRSEQSIMASWVSDLYKDSLTLFDRGYPGYALMYLMINQESARHFVIRCKLDFNKEVKAFVKSKSNSEIVILKPSGKAKATLLENGYVVNSKTTIKVRMVKIKLSTGVTEVLLTNLYDEELYKVADFKYLYALRWKIETSFDKQKNQQQMEQFSGHRVICIEQDYGACLIVANLQSLIEKQCENYLEKINSRRELCYKINKNVSWGSLKYNIVKLFLEERPREILERLQVAFERNIEPIRPGRHNPRIKKRNRLNGKYQTFTNYKRAV
jgi:hypothetical protein